MSDMVNTNPNEDFMLRTIPIVTFSSLEARYGRRVYTEWFIESILAAYEQKQTKKYLEEKKSCLSVEIRA